MKVRLFVKAMALVTALSGFPAAVAIPQTAETPKVVTLKSFDGFTQLRGKLVNFDGTNYTIETVLGLINVDAGQVECEGEACPQNLLYGARFGIHGSSTIGALMPALIEGFADSLDATVIRELGASDDGATLRIIHENGREMAAVDLRTLDSAAAFASLATGVAEIGMSSRRIRDQDMPQLTGAGLQDPRDTEAEHVIGLDGLIAVVHPDSPIQSISMEELALIFSGNATNWSQIGGPDQPINIYIDDESSGTYQVFEALALRPYGVQLTPEAQTVPNSREVSDSVAGDPNGIGVTALALERAARALPIRQECGILSYPTSFAMKTEEYPLSRRLYLYTPRQAMTAHARSLIDFAATDEAHRLIEDAGFVSLGVEAASPNNQGGRIIHAITGEEQVPIQLLRTFLNDVKSGVRLSTTFRFTPGASRLEPRSQQDAVQFARDLAAGKYAGKEILLLGFTDSVGQFPLNQALSARRAQVVADTLAAAAPEGGLGNAAIIVKGYGELAPVGCNTTPYGRSTNRRVEVWVRDPV